jgi:hypothetical protein
MHLVTCTSNLRPLLSISSVSRSRICAVPSFIVSADSSYPLLSYLSINSLVTCLTQYALVVLDVITVWLEWVCHANSLDALAAENMKYICGLAESVQRRATSWTARVGFPDWQDISLFRSVQTGSEVPAASYLVGTVGDFPRIIRPERETDHSPPSSSEVKNDGTIPPLPIVLHGIVLNCRSQRPRGLRHELSSLSRKLGSWIRIPFKGIDVYVCI